MDEHKIWLGIRYDVGDQVMFKPGLDLAGIPRHRLFISDFSKIDDTVIITDRKQNYFSTPHISLLLLVKKMEQKQEIESEQTEEQLGFCMRCGRQLTDPDSIARRYGLRCYEKKNVPMIKKERMKKILDLPDLRGMFGGGFC